MRSNIRAREKKRVFGRSGALWRMVRSWSSGLPGCRLPSAGPQLFPAGYPQTVRRRSAGGPLSLAAIVRRWSPGDRSRSRGPGSPLRRSVVLRSALPVSVSGIPMPGSCQALPGLIVGSAAGSRAGCPVVGSAAGSVVLSPERVKLAVMGGKDCGRVYVRLRSVRPVLGCSALPGTQKSGSRFRFPPSVVLSSVGFLPWSVYHAQAFRSSSCSASHSASCFALRSISPMISQGSRKESISSSHSSQTAVFNSSK